MPRGDKSKYTSKQKRQAAHIEKSYKDQGVSTKEAEKRAWATVNAETGGAGKKVSNTKPSQKGGRKSSRSKKSSSTHASH